MRTRQAPRHSGYGAQTTAREVIDPFSLDGARGETHRVRAFSVHPGAVDATDLMRSMSEEERRVAIAASRLTSMFKTASQGAATSVWCATSQQLDAMGGVYCEDVDIAEAVPADFPERRGVRPWAMDAELAERLWTTTEAWTGVTLSG